jgi:hypothetical protein
MSRSTVRTVVGLLLPFGVASSLLSSTVTGFVVDRAGMGRLLAMGTALAAAALVIFSAAGLCAIYVGHLPYRAWKLV